MFLSSFLVHMIGAHILETEVTLERVTSSHVILQISLSSFDLISLLQLLQVQAVNNILIWSCAHVSCRTQALVTSPRIHRTAMQTPTTWPSNLPHNPSIKIARGSRSCTEMDQVDLRCHGRTPLHPATPHALIWNGCSPIHRTCRPRFPTYQTNTSSVAK